MKILYLIYGPQSGVINSLCNALIRKGMIVDQINIAKLMDYQYKKYIPSLNPKATFNILLSILQFRRNWRRHFLFTTFAFKKMSRYAEDILNKIGDNYDIILQSGVLFSPSIRSLSRKKYVLYIDHTYKITKNYPKFKELPDPPYVTTEWEILETKAYQNAIKIFTMSHNVKNSLIFDYNIKPDKVNVVGAGPNFNIPKIKNKVYDSKKILFVGTNFLAKGGKILLQAFKIIQKEIPQAKLTIVGCSPKIRQEGVIVKGYLPTSKLISEYESASLFVLPTFREAFGISFLEAMAYKLPCIGTNIEAIPEIIDDGITGFIVPVNNFLKLAEKIIVVLTNKSLMKKMGEAGYQKVKKYYNWDLVADRMIEEFKKIS